MVIKGNKGTIVRTADNQLIAKLKYPNGLTVAHIIKEKDLNEWLGKIEAHGDELGGIQLSFWEE